MVYVKECGLRDYSELRIINNGLIKFYCDNKAEVSIAYNHVHHDRTKHEEEDRHFIKEKINGGRVCMTYIPAKEQIVDALTKRLHRSNFEDMVNKLGMTNIYIPA